MQMIVTVDKSLCATNPDHIRVAASGIYYIHHDLHSQACFDPPGKSRSTPLLFFPLLSSPPSTVILQSNARTVIHLSLRPAPGSRPADLFNKIKQTRGLLPDTQPCFAPLGNTSITVELISPDAVVLLTRGFSAALDPYSDPSLEYWTDEDHMCTQGSETDEYRVWNDEGYEILGCNHPRLVRFLGRDPWTALPTLEKPWATLATFLEEHRDAMYAPRGSGEDSGNGSGNGNETQATGKQHSLIPAYRSLIFQWALQLLSALSFLHKRNIILGGLHKHICWLQCPSPTSSSSSSSSTTTPTPSIKILGFLDAVYLEPMHATRYDNTDSWGSEYNTPFHPSSISPATGVGPGGRWDRDLATVGTDLFLWAGLVLELCVGEWPGGEGGVRMGRGMWPRVGEERLDGILARCWGYGYQSAGEVKKDLSEFLVSEGWEGEGVERDEIKGLDVSRILAG